MSDEIKNKVEKNEQHHASHKCKQHHCGKRGRFGKALFGVLAIVGVVWLAGTAFGPGCGHAGWHHGGHHWSEADISKRMDRMSDHLIDRVDASSEQAEQIKAITSSYATRLQPIKGKLMDNRKTFTNLLTETEVNRAELENVRLATFEMLNQNSQKLVKMVADIADVLTPEQRQQLAEHAQDGFHRFQ